jgi:hypothetical protein
MPVMVILMPAVAEELVATLLVNSLSGTLVSAIERAVSPTPNKTIPASIIARMAKKNGLTSTPLFNYTSSQIQIEEAVNC